jgi:uridine kinase
MRYVIAVAGPAGGGKSSLVGALLGALRDATAIYVDSYQRITEQPIREIVRWMERGADFDEFSIPLLSDHLAALKRGQPVVDPRTRREIAPAKYILFETHFGRAHRDTGKHVDLLLWIDTPLDIALARNVSDLLASGESPAGLQRYLRSYLEDVRRLRLMQRERICADADVALDGAAGFEAVLEQARRAILDRLP